MTTLSNSDKIVIIDQKIKNLDYQRYSVNLDIQLEGSVSTPDQDNLDSLNVKLSDIVTKLDILNTEKTSLIE
jgi:hypothetical protein